ncbi:hypothetical protein AURDEDRAFT_177610 [Auricularia subglabra TFB-10046 SS5]|uniref:Uncharacterized protein n=1 Tax=Auricularia subglabra (strain TFB-10046 / SS5) TaxID=717982 RepID=J0WN95_AURST|nr:hypothetical protein AURDEDRAFT_177610 [Auricularia subglabra TFB-10046 SS5]
MFPQQHSYLFTFVGTTLRSRRVVLRAWKPSRRPALRLRGSTTIRVAGFP